MILNKKENIFNQTGFTIVEALIFLAVSALVFAASVTAISSQNNRTAFAQSVRDFELRIQDMLNDAETGYYASDNTANCGSGTQQQRGTNSDCIFLGKAMEFNVGGNKEKYQVHTVIGDTKSATGAFTQGDINLANPRVVNDTDETKDLTYGLEVVKVVLGTTQTDKEDIDGFAVLSTLGKPLSSSGRVSNESGALQFAVYKVSGNGGFADMIQNNLSDAGGSQATKTITICLREGSNGKKAQIQLGINNQRLGTTSIVNSWKEALCG
jgi:type II secretory pathway pseudopilin PulG